MNCIPPQPGFLETLRRVCNEHASVLIFDEVMTGFRVALGGAQAHYGITPDLTCLGKIVGGGMPVGAFGGKREIMQNMSPMGPIYQAGTLSGNPLAMAAGIALLTKLQVPGFHDALTQRVNTLCQGLQERANAARVPMMTQSAGGMFGLFFTSQRRVDNFAQATACNPDAFRRFFGAMLDHGVYLAPSAYEAGFMSSAHTPEDIQFHPGCSRESLCSYVTASNVKLAIPQEPLITSGSCGKRGITMQRPTALAICDVCVGANSMRPTAGAVVSGADYE